MNQTTLSAILFPVFASNSNPRGDSIVFEGPDGFKYIDCFPVAPEARASSRDGSL